jgi:hypothetical protein
MGARPALLVHGKRRARHHRDRPPPGCAPARGQPDRISAARPSWWAPQPGWFGDRPPTDVDRALGIDSATNFICTNPAGFRASPGDDPKAACLPPPTRPPRRWPPARPRWLMPTSRKAVAVVRCPAPAAPSSGLPAYEQVKSDNVLYAHANRVLHLETNPATRGHRALPRRPRPVDQPAAHPGRHLPRWTYPRLQLYARSPHQLTPTSKAATTAATKIPAREMIRRRRDETWLAFTRHAPSL